MKDKYGINRAMFNYGKFSFDKKFNIVEFPKGTELYHGSANLAIHNYEFPMPEVYAPRTNYFEAKNKSLLKNNNLSPEQKYERLWSLLKIPPMYFGDIKVAKQYSQKCGTIGNAQNFLCEGNCIHAYISNNLLKLVDLSDPFNVMVIIKHSGLTASEIKIIRQHFGLSVQELKEKKWSHRPMFRNVSNKIYRGHNPFMRIDAPLEAKSTRVGLRCLKYNDTPKILSKIMKNNGYDGYILPGLNVFDSKGNVIDSRIAETILVNGKKSLSRNLEDPHDWQHQSTTNIKSHVIRNLMELLKKYKSFNIYTHAGDLYQHSIWTALHLEHWTLSKNNYISGISKDNYKFLVLLGFIHDIGKIQNNNKFHYYNIEKHPHYGSEMINKGDFKDLFDALNFKHIDYARVAALVCELHWDFGNIVKNNGKGQTQYIKNFKKEYAKRSIKKFSEEEVLLMLLAVSAADVKALQPFVAADTFKETFKNYTSKYFSFMHNVPQIWPGRDIFKQGRFSTTGLKIRNDLVKILSLKK
ncbi:MAG: hypothetical protein CL728_04870 [Chloroflexi bacterium]|nr:hypothetical protein [Chloroflexota bacterium]|tara:strand:- start:447 stop:2018 length:1572 start_codon:yes stop_codon:yes gene_type:complete